MDDDHQLVLIAAYPDLESAQTDFDEVERRQKHGLELRAAALVKKNADGRPEVVEAANHHGSIAVGLGAGLGALFGLFAPPLGLALFVGAASAGVVAGIVEHELRIRLQHDVGELLEPGTAVILSVVFPHGREAMEHTLGNARAFRELRLEKSTMAGIEDEMVALMSKIKTGTTPTAS